MAVNLTFLGYAGWPNVANAAKSISSAKTLSLNNGKNMMFATSVWAGDITDEEIRMINDLRARQAKMGEVANSVSTWDDLATVPHDTEVKISAIRKSDGQIIVIKPARFNSERAKMEYFEPELNTWIAVNPDKFTPTSWWNSHERATEVTAPPVEERRLPRPLDLSNIIQHAFMAGAGVKVGDRIPEEIFRQYLDYDPTPYACFQRVSTYIEPKRG